MGYNNSYHNDVLRKPVGFQKILLCVTLLFAVLICSLLLAIINRKYNPPFILLSLLEAGEVVTEMTRTENVKISVLKTRGNKSNQSGLSHDISTKSSYGCPECHSGALSCHVDWKREELGKIKKLWIVSFHATLMKDPFDYCFAFFIKGDCLSCHPTLFSPDNRKMPDYQRL